MSYSFSLFKEDFEDIKGG